MGKGLEQRAAFLSATYGLPGERFRLAAAPLSGRPACLGTGSWAIVTAWNPAGQRRSGEDNRRAEAALLAQLRDRSYRPGVNGDGEWAEPSVLLRHTSLREAVGLGRRFGQAAVLFGVGRRAALVCLEEAGAEVKRCWAVPSP